MYIDITIVKVLLSDAVSRCCCPMLSCLCPPGALATNWMKIAMACISILLFTFTFTLTHAFHSHCTFHIRIHVCVPPCITVHLCLHVFIFMHTCSCVDSSYSDSYSCMYIYACTAFIFARSFTFTSACCIHIHPAPSHACIFTQLYSLACMYISM